MGVDAAQVDRLSVHNADKEPGFEYIPPTGKLAPFANLPVGGKSDLNNTLFGSGSTGSGQGATKTVTGASHGIDQPVMTGGFKRLAQPANMYIHSALLDKHMISPDFVEQLRA